MADQAGTTHRYTYDLFGRLTADNAVTFGPGVDETVASIARGYEVRGMLALVSSLGSASTVLNQVELTYNSYSQLSNDYQNHSGAGATLGVGYSYADASANTIRRTGITYPNGDQIAIGYISPAADALSRADTILEASSPLCTYQYLGMSTVSQVTYNAASNLQFTLKDGGTGDAGDVYTGLDRFGRLVETLWKTGGADQVHSQYGRNRFGGVVWRYDALAHWLGVTTQDNYYWYDGLYQVKQHERGTMTGAYPNYTGITDVQQDETWGYDAIGNWDSYNSASPANSQTRTQNQANEITGISSSAGDVTPGYDAVGNMTGLPVNPGLSTSQYTLTWDAWNRLVKVQSGSTVVAAYAYDGLTRRITKTTPAETRQYFYNDAWRTLEERVDGASVPVDRQYTWGLADRWDLVRRKRSVSGASLNEALFVAKDYLAPVAIADTTGTVVERYSYDAFGQTLFMTPDFTPLPGSGYDWNYLFHAEFRDEDTTFYNYGYRYYFAQLGRWLSRDPVEEIDGGNSYALLGNHPIEQKDAFGLVAVINCNRCKQDIKGPWACWVQTFSGSTPKGPNNAGPVFSSNTGTNINPIPGGQKCTTYSVEPKPITGTPQDPKNPHVYPAECDLPPNTPDNPTKLWNFHAGIPSMTTPGCKPGTICSSDGRSWGSIRIHFPGLSEGCMTCKEYLQIEHLMNAEKNSGGLMLKLCDIDCCPNRLIKIATKCTV
jgi:RHS repeat-associated protein